MASEEDIEEVQKILARTANDPNLTIVTSSPGISFRTWGDVGPRDRERILSNWDERLRDCSSMASAMADASDILYQGLDGGFFVIKAAEVLRELLPLRIARLEDELRGLRAMLAEETE